MVYNHPDLIVQRRFDRSGTAQKFFRKHEAEWRKVLLNVLRHQNNLNIESDILLFCPVGRLSTRVVLNLTFFYFKRRTWHINTCNFHFRTGSNEIVSFDLCHDRSKKLSERLILHNYSYVYTKNQTEVCVIFFLLIIKMDFRGWYLISKAEKKLGSLLHGLSKLAEIELPLHA